MTEGQHTIDAQTLHGLSRLEQKDLIKNEKWDSERQVRALLEQVNGESIINDQALRDIAEYALEAGIDELKGILQSGCDIRTGYVGANVSSEVRTQWMFLASSLRDRIDELEEIKRQAEASVQVAKEDADKKQREGEAETKRLADLRERDEKEKKDKVKQEIIHIIERANIGINTILSQLKESEDIAKSIGNQGLIDKATKIRERTVTIQTLIEETRSKIILNGEEPEKVKNEANSQLEEIETKLKIESLNLKNEVDLAKKDTDAKKKIEDARNTKTEILNLTTEITRISNEAIKIINEALGMAEFDKVFHRVAGINAVKSEISSIQTASQGLSSRLNEIDTGISKFNAILSDHIEDKVNKANEVKTKAEDFIKKAKELIDSQKDSLIKAKEILEEGRKRRRDEVDGNFDFPPSTERDWQRAFVRKQLKTIEQTGMETTDKVNANKYNKLVGLRPEMDPQLAKEVEVRMRIHDAAVVIGGAGGNLKKIGTEAAALQNRKTPENIAGGLNREVIEATLINRLPGLEIGKAWDLIQEANFYYKRTVDQTREALEIKKRAGGLTPEELRELNNQINILTSTGIEITAEEKASGKRDINYETDTGNEQRRRLVRKYMLNKLGLAEDEAGQSMAIAEKLVIGTLETSIFNASEVVGSNQLGICVGFDMWRKRRGERERGPDITVDAIKGFSTSWLRYRYLYNLDNLADPSLAERDKPFYVAQIREIYTGLDNLEWGGFYCLTLLGRVDGLRELFLNTGVKGGEITIEYLRKYTKSFKESDPPLIKPDGTKAKNGRLRLKNLWIEGILDCALKTDPDLGWIVPDPENPDKGRGDFANLLNTLVLTPVDTSTNDGPFLNEEIWQWLKKAVNFNERVKFLEEYRKEKRKPSGILMRIASKILKGK